MKFGLRNIRSLLHSVDDPHKKIRTIHIAGTNGKGSTSSMIAAILTAAGYKVGLYTSPHLVDFNERIRINGNMISNTDVVRLTKILRPEIDRMNATFFEATTALAFRYFADKKVDIAVIETGLGGRLDSTNVLHPLVSVITSIGKDHTQILGTSIRSIAAEKAGIIKRKVPVVIGAIKGAAKEVISEIAAQKHSPLLESSKLVLPSDIHLQLKGQYQESNAKAAISAIAIVSSFYIIGDRAVREGLEHTREFTGLRARFELKKGKPDLLLDVGHNPDGIKNLVGELQHLSYKRIVLVFAVMKDKDYLSILLHFKKINPIIIATEPEVERALPSKQLSSLCREMGFTTFHAPQVKEAVALGKKKARKDGLLVVAGSHFLVGETIALMEKKS